jgi:hypothetical protein
MIFTLLILKMLLALTSPGKSNFRTETIDQNISIGYGVALGDVDGDKKPDIILADKKQIAWYRNGDWKKFVIAENLTEFDNVCVAAQDIDGDGKVEVAVGAQWNPSETKDFEKSGSVHFLSRPEDPTKTWKPIKLYSEPTIHRMRWIKSTNGTFYLAVLPLHGIENISGAGKPVNILLYQYPALLQKADPAYTISTGMHMTHNFDIVISQGANKPGIYIAGKEGVGFLDPAFSSGSKVVLQKLSTSVGAGEIRTANSRTSFITTIEPMHGTHLVVYSNEGQSRKVLDTSLAEGHALIAADFLGLGDEQVVAGWRRPDKNGKVGIKLYSQKNRSGRNWNQQWIDENGMACEDLQVMDLNNDGRLDIVASGRATRNLKIYWNISKAKK